MISFGWTYLSKFDTLGDIEQTQGFDATGFPVTIPGDNSMLILLYSVLTIVITVGVFVIYIANTRSAYKAYETVKAGKKPLGFVEEMRQFLDEILPEVVWDLLPFGFLYDLYKENIKIIAQTFAQNIVFVTKIC